MAETVFDERWQGVDGIFGGFVLACFVEEAATVEGYSPMSITVNFVSTISAGPADVTTTVLHRGRSTASLRIEVHQGGRLRAHATSVAVPGAREVSWSRVHDLSHLLAPEDSPLRENLPHRMPFYDNLEIRATGPFTKELGSSAWIRVTNEATVRDLGSARAVAAVVLDALPPSLLAGTPRATYVPTVEFTAHFSPALGDFGTGWYHATNEMIWTDDSYCVEESTLCLPDGRVVAQVRQSRSVRWPVSAETLPPDH